VPPVKATIRKKEGRFIWFTGLDLGSALGACHSVFLGLNCSDFRPWKAPIDGRPLGEQFG
jgi:hypothetical protein